MVGRVPTPAVKLRVVKIRVRVVNLRMISCIMIYLSFTILNIVVCTYCMKLDPAGLAPTRTSTVVVPAHHMCGREPRRNLFM